MDHRESAPVELQAAIVKMRQQVEKYCLRSGYQINPDAEIVETVLEGLARNRLRHGLAYCPCVMVSGDRGKDKSIICPCEAHKQDLAHNGMCHCALYVDPEFSSNQGESVG